MFPFSRLRPATSERIEGCRGSGFESRDEGRHLFWWCGQISQSVLTSSEAYKPTTKHEAAKRALESLNRMFRAGFQATGFGSLVWASRCKMDANLPSLSEIAAGLPVRAAVAQT